MAARLQPCSLRPGAQPRARVQVCYAVAPFLQATWMEVGLTVRAAGIPACTTLGRPAAVSWYEPHKGLEARMMLSHTTHPSDPTAPCFRWFSGAATAGYATASSCSTVNGDATVSVVSAPGPDGPFSCAC